MAESQFPGYVGLLDRRWSQNVPLEGNLYFGYNGGWAGQPGMEWYNNAQEQFMALQRGGGAAFSHLYPGADTWAYGFGRNEVDARLLGHGGGTQSWVDDDSFGMGGQFLGILPDTYPDDLDL